MRETGTRLGEATGVLKAEPKHGRPPPFPEMHHWNASSRGSRSLTHARPGPPSRAWCSKTGSFWAPIREPLTIRSWRTRAARRSTSSPPKSSETPEPSSRTQKRTAPSFPLRSPHVPALPTPILPFASAAVGLE
uniref:cDNA FLJ56610 n=1 Tax=Homo sapiens TaxID=9606 RepID=B4DNQ4_HUMAN|nr:unnamed protein product [Homo sapiens]